MNGFGGGFGAGVGGYAESNMVPVAVTGWIFKFPGRVWDYEKEHDDHGRLKFSC